MSRKARIYGENEPKSAERRTECSTIVSVTEPFVRNLLRSAEPYQI